MRRKIDQDFAGYHSTADLLDVFFEEEEQRWRYCHAWKIL